MEDSLSPSSALNERRHLLEQLKALIAKGEELRESPLKPPPGVLQIFPYVDSAAFSRWKTQAELVLERVLGRGDPRVERFRTEIKEPLVSHVGNGLGILQAVRDALKTGVLGKPIASEQVSLETVERICTRFHLVARQLSHRRAKRPTFEIGDEYDVQDLMHALLLLHFDDVRPEEYTPSYAGKASRMDFLLKKEGIVVEAKMTRPGLGARELSSQLIEDIERYKAHPDCKTLVCFVYDPGGHLPNPRGIENDLGRDADPFPVRVFIRPL